MAVLLWHHSTTGAIKVIPIDNVTPLDVIDSSNINLLPKGMGDFTGDGKLDYLFHNQNSGNLRIWEMDGTAKVNNISVPTGANVTLVPRGAGDMDGDGIPDIVLRNNNSGAVRVWTLNDDFTRKGNVYVTGSSNTNLELRGVVLAYASLFLLIFYRLFGLGF